MISVAAEREEIRPFFLESALCRGHLADNVLFKDPSREAGKERIMAKRSFDGPDTLEEPMEREGAVQKVKGVVSDTAEKAQQKAEEVGRVVQDKIDEKRGPVADKLEGVASTLEEKAESLPGGEKVASLAHDAADKVEATAQYVREHDVKDMMADLENLVRRHPGQSLIAAAAVGFLLGRAFKSDD